MKWSFNNDRPIYAQLIEQIQQGLLNGKYPPGSSMPSVRVLALEAEVNPNTMQRALAELETQGLLRSQRTAGRFVTEDETMIQKLKEDLAKSHIRDFFDGMRALGIERDEALALLRDSLAGDTGGEEGNIKTKEVRS
ncbi:MAG: GntR family transcriptional regulator [Clostridiales Family XIII bacterium]|jgi:DNA-binding transcriptional regulator YhcF (GntR family)|nr:GntR family transcriptional regulator [Clostridiales Family XIII bacterium]